MIGKKRKKVTRHRGTHTHSRGAKKKARGKGHRGGIGKAGTGKRADHKKSMYSEKGESYFGKSKVRRAEKKVIVEIVNLEANIDTYVNKKIGKKEKDQYEFDFKKFKIIGKDAHGIKMKIHAKAASKGAIEAVKKDGGEILIVK
jgi:large subunit ribosomal protein L15